MWRGGVREERRERIESGSGEEEEEERWTGWIDGIVMMFSQNVWLVVLIVQSGIYSVHFLWSSFIISCVFVNESLFIQYLDYSSKCRNTLSYYSVEK